jgi:hypothetical protein
VVLSPLSSFLFLFSLHPSSLIFSLSLTHTHMHTHISDEIISGTLTLLSDLCASVNVVRKLLSLESIQFIIMNHSPAHFPFLAHVSDTRHRTTFYTVCVCVCVCVVVVVVSLSLSLSLIRKRSWCGRHWGRC